MAMAGLITVIPIMVMATPMVDITAEATGMVIGMDTMTLYMDMAVVTPVTAVVATILIMERLMLLMVREVLIPEEQRFLNRGEEDQQETPVTMTTKVAVLL